MAYRVASTDISYPSPAVQVVEKIYSGFTDGRNVWLYRSTHAHADIEAVGFFTNGRRDGMRVGDALFNIAYSSAGSSAMTCHVVSASTGAIAASDTAGSSAFSQAYNCSVTVGSTG